MRKTNDMENKEERKVMARPIKETPILFGKDARRFEARMKERRKENKNGFIPLNDDDVDDDTRLLYFDLYDVV